jgi:hypothetical protein
MLQLAWLWLRHQPHSALSLWFHQRVGSNARIRKSMITAEDDGFVLEPEEPPDAIDEPYDILIRECVVER